MRYQLKQIHSRPWTLSGLSLKLIESHYENNYGGALRRLNAITEQLESLDYEKTPGHVINGLKRDEMTALNSTLLHELYFASMGGEGKATPAMSCWRETKCFGLVSISCTLPSASISRTSSTPTPWMSPNSGCSRGRGGAT